MFNGRRHVLISNYHAKNVQTLLKVYDGFLVPKVKQTMVMFCTWAKDKAAILVDFIRTRNKIFNYSPWCAGNLLTYPIFVMLPINGGQKTIRTTKILERR